MVNKMKDMSLVIGFKPIGFDKNYPHYFGNTNMVVPNFSKWEYFIKRSRKYEPIGVRKNHPLDVFNIR